MTTHAICTKRAASIDIKNFPTVGRIAFTTRKESSTMKSAAAVLVVSLTIATGCVNMSTLQTAKALEPGKQRILVGGGYYASPSVNADASASSGSEVSLALPYMEIGYRRGIIENLELGVKVTVPGTTGFDAKYQVVSAGDFAVAVGLGGSYLKISSTDSNNMETSTQLIDTIVPVYVSYDIAKPLAVYVSPKYVFRYASSVDPMETKTGTSHLVGGTGGIRLGNSFGLFLETSYLKDVSSKFDSFQVNGSIYF